MKQSQLRRSAIFCLALALSLHEADAENCTFSKGEIHQVSFSGSSLGPVTGHHTLRSDGPEITSFAAPHWTKDGKRYPTAYTKFSKPTVEMKFDFDWGQYEEETHAISVMAKGTDGVNLPERIFTLKDGKVTYTYGPAEADKEFPDEIKFYGPGLGNFTFEWSFKIDDGEYVPLGTTKHRIYLTAGTPTCAQGNRETLFYYACIGGSGGTPNDVTKKIYESFKKCEMNKINHETGILYGDYLYYYKDYKVGEAKIPGGLLESGNGVCGTWAHFFADVLHVHGYAPEVIGLTGEGILFPTWGGLGSETKSGSGWFVKGISGYTDPAEDVVAGQGPGKSDAGWVGHAITKAYGHYYDPSYGVGPCGSEAAYEQDAVGCYYYPYVFAGNVIFKTMFRTSSMPKQLTYTKQSF